MTRFCLWVPLCCLMLISCQDHRLLPEPQSTTCPVQRLHIAYTDPAGHKHWSTHRYDAQGRIEIMTDSSENWFDSTSFTYSETLVHQNDWIKGFTGNPSLRIYKINPQGYLLEPGYRFDQDGYLQEIDTPGQFHRIYTYSGGNLIKQVVEDGLSQLIYTYTYDNTKLGVPFSMDILSLFTGKPSRNLLLRVDAAYKKIGGNYLKEYTYADFQYKYDSLGRVARCERQHFIYGHSMTSYTYAYP